MGLEALVVLRVPREALSGLPEQTDPERQSQLRASPGRAGSAHLVWRVGDGQWSVECKVPRSCCQGIPGSCLDVALREVPRVFSKNSYLNEGSGGAIVVTWGKGEARR